MVVFCVARPESPPPGDPLVIPRVRPHQQQPPYQTATFLLSSDEVLRPEGDSQGPDTGPESEEGLCSQPQLPGA